VSFAAVTLCIAPQRVFIVVSLYFVIDSVRKLLDKPSYLREIRWGGVVGIHLAQDKGQLLCFVNMVMNHQLP
jgi:hypothetical protein